MSNKHLAVSKQQPLQAGRRFGLKLSALILFQAIAPAEAAPWNLERTNAEAAHKKGYTGAGITVGVIDGGIDPDHPAFAGLIDPRSFNFLSNASSSAIDGHGTHVAGILAAKPGTGPMHGIAYGANLLDLRAVKNADLPDFDDNNAPARALRYAVKAGAKVVNGSYGPKVGPPPYIEDPDAPGTEIRNPDYVHLSHQIIAFDTKRQQADDAEEYAAVEYAAANDVVMVFSAGNEYPDQPLASAHPFGNALLPYLSPKHHADNVYQFVDSANEDSDPNNPDTYRYIDPSSPQLAKLDYSHLQGALIAVVATDKDNRIASYSNRCGAAWQWCMAAPGGDIGSDGLDTPENGILAPAPGQRYATEVGTSQAAPLVAGAAAVVRSAFPYLTARQTIELLLTTTNTSGHLADRAIYGRGLLDLGRAVQGPREFGAEGFPGVFDVDTKGHDSVWSGDIHGAGGLVKRGAGNLELSGANSYRGDTVVAGGALTVSGSIASSALSVLGDGALQGGGTVGPTRMAGTIAPGPAGTTLSVSGGYTHQDTGIYQATIDSDGNASRIDVQGKAALQGGTLNVAGVSVGTFGKQYTLLNAVDGVDGDFAVKNGGTLFLDLQTKADSGRYTVSVIRNKGGFGAVARTANQRATGRGADGMRAGQPVFDTLLSLQDPADARRVLDRLSGDMHPSLLGVLIEQGGATRNAMLARTRQFSGAQGLDRPAGGDTALWGQYVGSRGDMASDGNAAGLRWKDNGMLFGADKDVSANTRLGLALGFGKSDANAANRHSKAKIDNYTVAAYGGTQAGPASLRYGASLGWHRIESRRNVAFAYAEPAKAGYTARSSQLFTEAGLPQTFGGIDLEPYAGLAYANVRANGFKESGTAGLRGEKASQDALFSTLGLRAGSSWTLNDGSTLSLRGQAGWRHAFGGLTPSTRMHLQDARGFTVQGLPLARDTLQTEAGIGWDSGRNANVGLSYVGEYGSRISNHGVRANVIWRF